MRKIIYTIPIIIIASIFISCVQIPVVGNHSAGEIKIVRILSPIEAEVISDGKLQIVMLAGVSILTETEYKEKYLKTGKIEGKFNEEIIDRIKKSSKFFNESVSHGDILYAIDITKNPEVFKVKQLIIYTPDMVSINEKMIIEGYGFPGGETASPEFDAMIKKSLETAVLYRKGLWRIGEIMIKESL
jgi:hypothetical protein